MKLYLPIWATLPFLLATTLATSAVGHRGAATPNHDGLAKTFGNLTTTIQVRL